MVLSAFVTLSAWAALVLVTSGLVVGLRGPRRTPVGQVVGSVAAILLALGILLRSETPLYLPLTFAGCVLGLLSLAFVLRARGA